MHDDDDAMHVGDKNHPSYVCSNNTASRRSCLLYESLPIVYDIYYISWPNKYRAGILFSTIEGRYGIRYVRSSQSVSRSADFRMKMRQCAEDDI